MRRCLPLTVKGRTIIGLVALYGLLLQAVLGFATPARLLSMSDAVLCADHTRADAPADQTRHTYVHPCCTLVHAVTAALPPAGPAALIWPSARRTHLVWQPEAELERTGPPSHTGSARGPPSA